MREIIHGKIYTYAGLGCRCEECRTVNARYSAAAKAKRVAIGRCRNHPQRPLVKGSALFCADCRLTNAQRAASNRLRAGQGHAQ